MMWTPMNRFSEIVVAEEYKLPVFWWPRMQGSEVQDPVAMEVGKRYSIELEHMQIEAEVCRINYGAESPLHLMWLSRCGSTLLGWFSPDQFIEVAPV